jgi:ABC-type oligopeptide transport system substrate-binding subunit
MFFQKQTGTSFQFVPYRGGAPAIQDLAAGQIALGCDLAANSLSQLRNGNIKAYAVTAKNRLASAPDIPTSDEAGLPGFYLTLWNAFWAPKGTQMNVITRLISPNASGFSSFVRTSVFAMKRRNWLTPLPAYYSRGERVISQLKAIGIQTRLQTMERGVYLKRMEGGLKEWPGLQIIMNATRMGGSWSNWYDGMFRCGGFQSKDMICVKALDDKFAKYSASVDRAERKNISEEIQKIILDEYYFVPVFRHAFLNVIGPRIAATKWEDVFPTITTGYAYPWEDIELKT